MLHGTGMITYAMKGVKLCAQALLKVVLWRFAIERADSLHLCRLPGMIEREATRSSHAQQVSQDCTFCGRTTQCSLFPVY